MKLRVEYEYPNRTKGNTLSNDSPRGESIEPSKKSNKHAKVPNSPNSSIYNINDLQILKSKYDTIVEYTVHLTAERDMIAAQHDVLKREYTSELKKKEKTSPRSSNSLTSKSDAEENKTVKVI